MNYSTAIFLINDDVRAVHCTYEQGDGAKRTAFKTLDETITEGDFVVVPTTTRHELTVVKVVEVDVDLDFDDPNRVEWIVGKVDLTDHEKLLDQENEAIKAIKSAELRRKREALRDAMFADHVETLKALPIAAIAEDETPSDKAAGE